MSTITPPTPQHWQSYCCLHEMCTPCTRSAHTWHVRMQRRCKDERRSAAIKEVACVPCLAAHHHEDAQHQSPCVGGRGWRGWCGKRTCCMPTRVVADTAKPRFPVVESALFKSTCAERSQITSPLLRSCWLHWRPECLRSKSPSATVSSRPELSGVVDVAAAAPGNAFSNTYTHHTQNPPTFHPLRRRSPCGTPSIDSNA